MDDDCFHKIESLEKDSVNMNLKFLKIFNFNFSILLLWYKVFIKIYFEYKS